MVHNLVYNLCESLVTNIGDIADTGKRTPPTPITYLTQWQMLGNSQVHTLPYPDGVVLPTGYKRCEYLTFDGSSYINTGIKTANDIGYNFACSINGETKCLIGARLSQNAQGFVLGFAYVAYGGSSINKGITYNQTKTTVILDSTQCEVGGINYDISNIKATADSFLDIYIGSWNSNNVTDARMWEGNIYDTIIYNTQGELWHGIPCLDANDVPCFYDIVSQTAFYNQGSGSFTYKLYPQPTEIWSCGEYNATDGKYHILVQPLGGSIADIALDEPLRKVNDVADTIEFPSGTEGKALVMRNILSYLLEDMNWSKHGNENRYYTNINSLNCVITTESNIVPLILCNKYTTVCFNDRIKNDKQITALKSSAEFVSVIDSDVTSGNDIQGEILLQLATPTTELVDAPQIEEADSYTCVISQGAKAVGWTEFVANPT